jgi:hypothetical protein
MFDNVQKINHCAIFMVFQILLSLKSLFNQHFLEKLVLVLALGYMRLPHLHTPLIFYLKNMQLVTMSF